ncbi:response regulator [Spirulina sp. 06S082]|uniref:response regulator n=1 Tax=Spirulina sp. 06S082 TaxID=3110248 RepID=UPI002B1FD214|nr:response regulator [Spirulina sp. 06S082]MEA5470338.1 response regulator [Spirulina sp. 06S082]
MSTTTATLVKLYKTILNLHQKQATGIFTLTSGKKQWQFFFNQGQIAYVVDRQFRVRRWKRAVREQNGLMETNFLPTANRDPWEYYYLLQEVSQQKLSPAKVRIIIQTVLRESLFAIAAEREIKGQWQSGWKLAKIAKPELSLPANVLKPLFSEIQQLKADWQTLGLNPQYADRAPNLQLSEDLLQSSSASLLNLKPLLNGKRSFWDLAATMKQSFTAVIRLLRYYIQQKAIAWSAIADLPTPFKTVATPTPKDLSSCPLVACVDDSPHVCFQMEELLEHLGYRCLSINDPVQALPELMQHKPDFILMDLVMPVMNGYELCSHLRRVPSLQETPTVLMTGSNNIVDRVRGKMVGANDLLLKPIEREQLKELLKKYLNPANPQSTKNPVGNSRELATPTMNLGQYNYQPAMAIT